MLINVRPRSVITLSTAVLVAVVVGYNASPGSASDASVSFELEHGTVGGAARVAEGSAASAGKFVAFQQQSSRDAVNAFPGAQGFGTSTPGGRGGRVLEVTNLNDAGPGSLRAALEASGPRIVVFRTSGTIELDDEIDIRNPYLTVAGQTAPGGGITLKSRLSNSNGLIDIHSHDVVIRYLRFRSGPHTAIAESKGMDIADGSHHIVIDHCSFSWAVDENLTSYDFTHDITFSWNIVAEALSHSSHPEGEHSRGMFLSGERSRNVTAHHNLIAHNMRRNPEVNTAGMADIRNNVVYNWGTHAAQVSDKNGDHPLNFVANYFKPGPSTDLARHELDVYPQGPGMRMYVDGNLGPRRPDDTLPNEDSVAPEGRRWMSRQSFAAPAVTTTSARQAYADVLAGAGVRVPQLDEVDRRIIEDVKTGTGRIIDHPRQVGGWPSLAVGTALDDGDSDGMPDSWERARGLDPTRDDSSGDRDGDGYSNIEDYVNGLVSDVRATAGSCPALAKDHGTVVGTVTTPAPAELHGWARMRTEDGRADSFVLQIEDACYAIAGRHGEPGWRWVDYRDPARSAPATIRLRAGEHTVRVIGTDSDVDVDRILLIADATCVPTGTGDNCA